MVDLEFTPPTGALRGQATSGMVKTATAQMVRFVVQFSSVILLSRLLSPAEFGLVAMAGPIVSFAAIFQDLGLTQAIVQKTEIRQDQLSSLFFVSVAVSAAIAAALIVLAPFSADFYKEPRVSALTMAMSANIVVSSFGSVHYALLNRQMRFGIIAILDGLSAVVGLVVSVGLAALYHSYWSLFFGSLASTLIPTVGYWAAARWRPSRPKRGSGSMPVLMFGANVTGFNLANFFARNLDNVLIGRYWGDQPLGLYDRAYKLLLMPLQQINNPLSKVMLPTLSRLVDDSQRYQHAFERVLCQVLILTLPGIAFLVCTSDLFIPLLLGEKWVGAAPIFSALGTASFLQVLNNPTGWLFLSQGRAREYMRWGLFGSVTAIASFVIFLPYGPVGVAIGYALSEYIRTPILWWYLCRSGPIRAGAIFRAVSPHYVGAAISVGILLALRHLFDLRAPLLLGIALPLSYLASLATLMASQRGRATLAETRKLCIESVEPLLKRKVGPDGRGVHR